MKTVQIKGLADLNKVLKTLPEKLERNVLRAAIREGAAVIMREAKANVPIATPNLENQTQYGGYAGALRDSIRVSTRLRNGKVTASVIAGGKTKRGANVYYARWVEYGTAAHTILPAKVKSLFFGGKAFESVEHPGASPRPFMRPAMDTRATAALQAFADGVKKRLTKQGLEAPDVEVDEGGPP
jgi:HK97 gp10 family phage protein